MKEQEPTADRQTKERILKPWIKRIMGLKMPYAVDDIKDTHGRMERVCLIIGNNALADTLIHEMKKEIGEEFDTEITVEDMAPPKL